MKLGDVKKLYPTAIYSYFDANYFSCSDSFLNLDQYIFGYDLRVSASAYICIDIFLEDPLYSAEEEL